MNLSERLKLDISAKRQQKERNIENYRQELLVVDAQKEPYDNAVRIIDESIFGIVQGANDLIYETAEAYQERIDSGCKSDLFWRLTSVDSGGSGNYNLVATRTSDVGYGTSLAYLDPVTSTIIYFSPDAKIGVSTQNLYAMIYYDQKYLQDIGDTTLGTFIGKVGAGSTELAIISLTPDELIQDFEIENVIICSKQGVFASPTNKIVGFGTTTLTGLSSSVMESLVGIATTTFTTRTAILETPTVGFSSLPEVDGKFVDYTVVISPEDFQAQEPRFRYSTKTFDENPFSPETIGVLTPDTFGIGYRIKIDNSGYPSATQSWKPELKGVEKNGEKVDRPNVGGGSIYFKTGFNYRPVNIFGNPVTEGTTASVSPASLSFMYQSLSSCSTSINASITSALNKQQEYEETMFGDSSINLAAAANALRQERSEYALRIWGMRQSIRNQNTELDSLGALDGYIKQQDSIIDKK